VTSTHVITSCPAAPSAFAFLTFTPSILNQTSDELVDLVCPSSQL
jgi:hypothetical protein